MKFLTATGELPTGSKLRTLALVLVAMGIWCLTLHGADRTNVYEFQESIPKPGSIQWDRVHRIYKERQELYRKRIAIPDAVGTNVPVAAGAYLAFNRAIPDVSAPAPSGAFGTFLKLLTYLALFIGAGVLLLRKFAPHILVDLNRQYNPWLLNAVGERNFNGKVRAEEEAFSKYLAALRVGPSQLGSPVSPEKLDPLVKFCARAKEILTRQKKLLGDIGGEGETSARRRLLTQLDSTMGRLKGEAGNSGALPFWQVAAALEGLLKRLVENASDVSPSTLRTVGGCLDLLDKLCLPDMKPNLLTDRPIKFLIVDDDPISRKALALSLKKAFSEPDHAEDGQSALAQTSRQVYNVIFLDVQMPGMDGFELCTKIRSTGPNRTTPVVFVTNHSDFDARAKSTLSGGNDLMAKPFLIFEVTVKALTLALQGRLQSIAEQPVPEPDLGAVNPNLSLASKNELPAVAKPTNVMIPLLSQSPVLGGDGLADAFLDRASKNLGSLQELCQAILQASDMEARQTLLAKAFLRISSMLVQPDRKLTHPGYQMCIALEGLLKKLLQDSKNCTPSTLATLATAVDLLEDLCVRGMKADLAIHPPIHILVVDDDLVARRIITGALQVVFEKPESVESGEAALAVLVERPFDVIFLDVIMPGMDGFEVCAKIRGIASHRATPVVFVSSLDDLEARAKASRNGGNDLMGKPFLSSEIAVKALAYALRGRLQRLGQNTGVDAESALQFNHCLPRGSIDLQSRP